MSTYLELLTDLAELCACFPHRFIEPLLLLCWMLQKGWHLGEYNMWEKRTVWELGTRVPFMVHVPWLPQSHGRHTAGLTELVSQPAPAWPCVWYQIHNSQYQHVSYCVETENY